MEARRAKAFCEASGRPTCFFSSLTSMVSDVLKGREDLRNRGKSSGVYCSHSFCWVLPPLQDVQQKKRHEKNKPRLNRQDSIDGELPEVSVNSLPSAMIAPNLKGTQAGGRNRSDSHGEPQTHLEQAERTNRRTGPQTKYKASLITATAAHAGAGRQVGR